MTDHIQAIVIIDHDKMFYERRIFVENLMHPFMKTANTYYL